MTPRQLGYRMPAEWEPHAATWLSWPRPDGISFPGRYDEVLPTLAEMVRLLAAHETVCINCRDEAVEAIARRAIGPVPNVVYHRIPSYEPWCRDHGPIFIKRNGELAIVDWDYNAWGGKYPPFDDDDAVPRRVAEVLGLLVFRPGIVMEGGALDVNGAGQLLTTESCLLNPNRNPHLTRAQIEQILCDYLGVHEVLWLGEGIVGDDTDGHVDDLARFVSRDTVVAMVEPDPRDPNHEPLQDNLRRLRSMPVIQRVVELTMPRVVEHEGQRLPASYANFYIANDIVLLPTFRQPDRDEAARATLQSLFSDRRVVGLDSTVLIWGLGSFHCLTQQQPR
ncbi:MAG: agmatine deiminase family protein [Verrucomicrobiae bacterium]|nr:agmatine deiminase family protein [Verrucomicrobiae bacterium]